MQLMLSNRNLVKKHGANNMFGHREMINGVVSKVFSFIYLFLGASIVKWTKKVLWYTKATIFLVKRL